MFNTIDGTVHDKMLTLETRCRDQKRLINFIRKNYDNDKERCITVTGITEENVTYRMTLVDFIKNAAEVAKTSND